MQREKNKSKDSQLLKNKQECYAFHFAVYSSEMLSRFQVIFQVRMASHHQIPYQYSNASEPYPPRTLASRFDLFDGRKFNENHRGHRFSNPRSHSEARVVARSPHKLEAEHGLGSKKAPRESWRPYISCGRVIVKLAFELIDSGTEASYCA